MTALTVNGSAAAATTLGTAGKLFNTTGGTSGNTSTKVGSGTLFKQVFALGTTTNQTGVASIPAPTDSNFSGWMWDVTTLEGQLLQAGTLTPTIHLLASTGTTVTPTAQWYKRSSAGAYTQLATVTGSSLALTTSSQALTFTAPSMSDTAFAVGDKLVMWLWVNQTAGGATNSTISVVEAISGSTAGVTSEAQTVTPGFIPIVTTTYSFTDNALTATDTLLGTDAGLPVDNLTTTDSLLTSGGGGPTTLAQDTFTRANTTGSTTVSNVNGWGTASDGETWVDVNGAGGSWKILGNEGVQTANWGTNLLLGSGTATDQESLVRCTSNDFSSHFPGIILRSNATGSTWYRARMTNVSTVVHTEAFVAVCTFTFAPTNNTFYWLRFRAQGTTFSIKVWADGSSEPGAWSATGTNSAHASGQYGLYESGGTTCNIQFDTFQVNSIILRATNEDDLTASDGVMGVDAGLFIDALSADDSASAMTQVPTGGGVTTTTYSFVDALAVSENLLTLEIGNPIESLISADSLVTADSSFSTESLSTTSGLFGTNGSVSTDTLLALDSFLESSGSISLDGLPISSRFLIGDGNLSTETTIVSDTLSGTLGSGLLTLSLSTSDSLLIGGTNLSTEATTVSASVLGQRSGFLTESIPASDVLFEVDTALTQDVLSITDQTSSLARWPVDSLTLAESILVIAGVLPLESITGVSLDLGTDRYAPVEALLADDSASTMALAPSNTYSFTDILLVVSESLFTLGSQSPTPGLTVGESLFQVQGNMSIEGSSASDNLLGQSSPLMIESLSPGDLLTRTDIYLPAEVQSVAESLSLSGSYTFLETGIPGTDTLSVTSPYMPTDALIAGDLGNAQSWGMDTLVISDSFSIAGVWNPASVSPGSSSIRASDLPLLVETLLGSDLLLMENVFPPPTAVLSSHPIGASPSGNYEGKTVVPARPSGIYLVNGVPLDSQPIVCTAPLESGSGLRFLVGSTFFLLFDRPSTLTQSLLPDGGVVSMTFALASGNMVTVPQVQVASTLVVGVSIATLAVTCTLLSSLATPTLSLASSS